jgi:hypothetical protein
MTPLLRNLLAHHVDRVIEKQICASPNRKWANLLPKAMHMRGEEELSTLVYERRRTDREDGSTVAILLCVLIDSCSVLFKGLCVEVSGSLILKPKVLLDRTFGETTMLEKRATTTAESDHDCYGKTPALQFAVNGTCEAHLNGHLSPEQAGSCASEQDNGLRTTLVKALGRIGDFEQEALFAMCRQALLPDRENLKGFRYMSGETQHGEHLAFIAPDGSFTVSLWPSPRGCTVIRSISAPEVAMRQAEDVEDFVEYRLFSQGTLPYFVCTARCGHILNTQAYIEMKSQANAEYA